MHPSFCLRLRSLRALVSLAAGAELGRLAPSAPLLRGLRSVAPRPLLGRSAAFAPSLSALRALRSLVELFSGHAAQRSAASRTTRFQTKTRSGKKVPKERRKKIPKKNPQPQLHSTPLYCVGFNTCGGFRKKSCGLREASSVASVCFRVDAGASGNCGGRAAQCSPGLTLSSYHHSRI